MDERTKANTLTNPVRHKQSRASATPGASSGSSSSNGHGSVNRHAARKRRSARVRASHRRMLVGGSLLGAAVVGILVMLGITLFAHRTVATLSVSSPRSDTAQELAAQALLASTNMPFRFGTLNQLHTDSCANLGNKPAIYAAMAKLPKGSYLQGSCCSPMDFAHYQRQIAALKAYASIPQIPADPYNVAASLASSMLQDDQTISLTPTQQATYNQASALTDDRSWCCCQCWAWYAHSGLAKYLITARQYSVVQLVAVTNLEDCCGGA